jgi:recombination protein RecA
MSTASALRLQIERSLEYRFPSALTPAPRVVCEVAPIGIAVVDSLLDGGLPIGAISEVTGVQSSGRTSLVLSFLARRTQEGQVCAWVDADDTLDPESAAANGVALSQLLWARCEDATKHAKGKPWSKLDQALRATDLLLQTAGFGSVVLDLGNIAMEHARRIPLATWFRFRQAAQRSRASLVVLGQSSYAQSSAEVVLECAARRRATTQTVLEDLSFEVRIHRKRFQRASNVGKKSPVSIWTANGAWTNGSRTGVVQS